MPLQVIRYNTTRWLIPSQVLAPTIACAVWFCITSLSGIWDCAHLGNKGHFLQVNTSVNTGHRNFCNATQTILNPNVPQFSTRQSPTVCNSCYSFLSTWVLIVCLGSWTWDLLHSHAWMNIYTRCKGWWFNQLSYTNMHCNALACTAS